MLTKFSKTFSVNGLDFERAGEVSTSIKSILKDLSINPRHIRRISIACFEAEMNIVIHAFRGTVLFEIDETSIVLTFKDEGPGIPDIEQAMQVGFSTAPDEIRKRGFGAGMGLPNIKMHTDFMNITSIPNIGTTLIIKIIHT